jgi:AcrR family transcriptional regulator
MTTSPRVRLDPETRRAQLLDLGVSLLATRSLEEMSIDVLAEHAGISRGLLYHYFGNKQDFHLAVVRRMVEDLYAATAPVDSDEVAVRLSVSLKNYLDFVVANRSAYESVRRAALGGTNPAMREAYEAGRSQLLDRIFDSATEEQLAAHGIVDTPATRLLTRGWGVLVEEVVLDWLADPRGIGEDELIASLTLGLGALLSVAPA